MEPINSSYTQTTKNAASSICNLHIHLWQCVHYGISRVVTWIEESCLESFYIAKKIYGILLEHGLYFQPSIQNGLLLAKAKNISQKNVIWNETDYMAARNFQKILTNKEFYRIRNINPLDKVALQVITNFEPERVYLGGVCFGATLSMIRSTLSLNCQSETEIINLMQSVKNGCPADVAGLQQMYNAIVDWQPQLPEELKQKFLEDLEKTRLKLLGNLDIQKQELIKLRNKEIILQKINELKDTMALQLEEAKCRIKRRCYDQYRVERIHPIAHLIGLQLQQADLYDLDTSNFTGITSNDSIKERFNKLPPGCYQLLYPTGNAGHALAYLNLSCGSYIYDPNIGLIKCIEDNPSKTLCSLFEQHYPNNVENGIQNDQKLYIYDYKLRH